MCFYSGSCPRLFFKYIISSVAQLRSQLISGSGSLWQMSGHSPLSKLSLFGTPSKSVKEVIIIIAFHHIILAAAIPSRLHHHFCVLNSISERKSVD
jgi:hypothetical protein